MNRLAQMMIATALLFPGAAMPNVSKTSAMPIVAAPAGKIRGPLLKNVENGLRLVLGL